MVETTQLREKLEAARDTFDYRLEKVLFDVAEQVCKLLESQGKTRAELAKLLDVTPAYVTKILNGNPNLTIKSLLKLSDALGQPLAICVTPRLEIIKVASASQSTPLNFVDIANRLKSTTSTDVNAGAVPAMAGADHDNP